MFDDLIGPGGDNQDSLAAPSTAQGRPQLAYLDGMRGWAALFVVYHHTWQFVVTRPDVASLPRWFTAMTVFKFGQYAVPVFIVLSGYCLMLPAARSLHAELSGGVATFLKRRARRILPPYYAALGAALCLILAYSRLQVPTCTQWDIALPALTPASIVSHLALVQNFLRCRAHNELGAEQDFGAALMARKRDSFRHESRRAQGRDL